MADICWGPIAGVGTFELAPARQQDEDESHEREQRTASHPGTLIDHETRCRPVDEAGTLRSPQESGKQSNQAEDQQGGLHHAVALTGMTQSAH